MMARGARRLPYVVCILFFALSTALPETLVAAHSDGHHGGKCVSQQMANAFPPSGLSVPTEERRRTEEVTITTTTSSSNIRISVVHLHNTASEAPYECLASGDTFTNPAVEGTSQPCSSERSANVFSGSCVDGICSSIDVVDDAQVAALDEQVTFAVDTIQQHLSPISPPGAFNITDTSCNALTAVDHFGPYEDTDFVLFVTTRPTWGGVVAWGLPCAYDDTTTRPIAGLVNAGAQYIGQDSSGRVKLLHELVHALGMEEQSMTLGFLNPLTGAKLGADKVFATVEQTEGRSAAKSTRYVVSDAVTAFVKDNTGCDTLVGAELEGEDFTSGIHWERRMFADELMTATGLGVVDTKLTGLTLALFEDSGWYDVDYDGVGTLDFSSGEGCDIASEPCPVNFDRGCRCQPNGYIADGSPAFKYIDSVCSPFTGEQVKMECTAQQQTSILEKFEYLDLCDPSIGGDQHADYCPVFLPNSLFTLDCRYSGDVCRDTSILLGSTSYEASCNNQIALFQEEYGSDAMCIDGINPLGPALATAYGADTHPIATCHRYRCLTDGTFQLHLDDTWEDCPIGGTLVHTATSIVLSCPATEEIRAARCAEVGVSDSTGSGTTTTTSTSTSTTTSGTITTNTSPASPVTSPPWYMMLVTAMTLLFIF